MSGRTLFDGASPKTQTIEAVKQLIAYQQHHGQVPAEMPAFYRLSGEMVLVLSNKEDAYYVVTAKACSCPAATYQPGRACKHQRKFFPQPKKSQAQTEAESDAELVKIAGPKRLAMPPADSIRPGKNEGWGGGMNGPVDPAEVVA